MAEAATATAAAGLPNHGGGGSNPGSGTSTPGSRFRVDATDSRKNSGGSAAGLGGPLLPVNGETPAVAPPPYASSGDCLSASAASAELDTNGTKTASTELLSPGSREGELSVPIIALPDGEFVGVGALARRDLTTST